jgi:hypothetical protein
MLRFFPNAKRSLDSLLILITDLVTDGLLFFRLLYDALPFLEPLKFLSELWSLAHACIGGLRSPNSDRTANCLSFAVLLGE